jgi:hypothetical protein
VGRETLILNYLGKGKEMLSVGNVGPKNDHVERSDLAVRFFIAGWERERAKRAKRERGREGQGLKYPSGTQHDLIG